MLGLLKQLEVRLWDRWIARQPFALVPVEVRKMCLKNVVLGL